MGFSCTPSNPWVGVGWRKRDDVVLEVKPCLTRKKIEFVGEPATEKNHVLKAPGIERLKNTLKS